MRCTVRELIRKNKQKIRFLISGVGATAVDFISYSIAIAAGLTNIPANFISTSLALCFSFFANKNFTFKQDEKTNARQVLSFIVATLIGIWVLQPIVISLLYPYVARVVTDYLLASILAKCAATVVSLTWNYIMYSKVVFAASAAKDKDQN